MRDIRWTQLVQLMVGGGALAFGGCATYFNSDFLRAGGPGLVGTVGAAAFLVGITAGILGVILVFVPALQRPLRPGVAAALILVGAFCTTDKSIRIVGIWLASMGLILLVVPWLMREPEEPSTPPEDPST